MRARNVLVVCALSAGPSCSAQHEPAGKPQGTEPDRRDECDELFEEGKEQCLPGMQFFSDNGNSGQHVVIAETVSLDRAIAVGSEGWLVEVFGPDELVGWYTSERQCAVGCGWCMPGESMCFEKVGEEMEPTGCTLCLAYDLPDIGTQCEAFLAECSS